MADLLTAGGAERGQCNPGDDRAQAYRRRGQQHPARPVTSHRENPRLAVAVIRRSTGPMSAVSHILIFLGHC
jgi:hypothetical protein